ncbi:hypothetical protein QPI79_002233 [Enterococcus faecalis]|nr:hypothetical protein [Enterococcus faecalis]
MMKFLAYLTRIGKELFLLFSVIMCVTFLFEVCLYVLYVSAVEAHIPLSNLQKFTNNILSVAGVVVMGCFLGLALLSLQLGFTRKRSYKLLMLTYLLVLCLAVGTSFPFSYTHFEQLINKTILIMLYTLLGWFLFTMTNRIVANFLFRKLFKSEFQNQCLIFLSEDNFFYSVNWIRTSIDFLIKHFRNCRKTAYVPLKLDDEWKEFSIDEESNVYTEKPFRVNKDYEGITITFKWVPLYFHFEAMKSLEWSKPITETGTKDIT